MRTFHGEKVENFESLEGFHGISIIRSPVIENAIANLAKYSTRSCLIKAKTKRTRRKSVKFDEFCHFVVFKDKQLVSLGTEEVWKGYLLTEHQFNDFLANFSGQMDLALLRGKKQSRKIWREIMRRGSPPLLSLSAADSQLNHISLLREYVGGVVTRFSDVAIDASQTDNVYTKALKKAKITMKKRIRGKKLNDLKGMRQIEAHFTNTFNSDQIDEDYIRTLIDCALLKLEDRHEFFEIFKIDVFKKVLIRFAVIKTRIETYVTQKLSHLFRKLFSCPILNNTDDSEFYNQGLKVLNNMFSVLKANSQLMEQCQADYDSPELQEILSEGLAAFPIDMLGKFVAQTSETTCVDLFTGSKFDIIAQGKLELMKSKLALEHDQKGEIPNIGDIFDAPIVLLPSAFSSLQNFFVEPMKIWDFYKDQWMLLNLDLISSGIINACLNNNVPNLKFFESFEISKIISDNSIGYKNDDFQKTFINLTNSLDIHRNSVLLNPIVRADLRLSTNKSCEFNCNGHRNELLRISLNLNHFEVFYYLLDNGLSLTTNMCSQSLTDLYWGVPPKYERFSHDHKKLKIKLYSRFKKTKFINIILENLFNTMEVKNKSDLEAFEEKFNIFESIKSEVECELDDTVLFKVYYSLYKALNNHIQAKSLSLRQIKRLTGKMLEKSENAYQLYPSYYMVSILSQSKFEIGHLLLNLLNNRKYKLLLEYKMNQKQVNALFSLQVVELTNATCRHREILRNQSFLLNNFKISKNARIKLCNQLLKLNFDFLLVNETLVHHILPRIIWALDDDTLLFTKLYIKLFRFDFGLMHDSLHQFLDVDAQRRVLTQILEAHFLRSCFYFSPRLLSVLPKMQAFTPDLLNELFLKFMERNFWTVSDLKVIRSLIVEHQSAVEFNLALYEKFIVKLLLVPSFSFEKLSFLGYTATKPLMTDLVRVKCLTDAATRLFVEELDDDKGREVFVRVLKVLRKIAKKNKTQELWFEGIAFFINRVNLILDLEEDYNDPHSVIPRITRYFNRKKKWEMDYDGHSTCVLSLDA